MIQKETILNVTDNSGAQKVLMFGCRGYSKKKTFTVGDIVKVAVKKTIPNAKVKSGEIYFALIVRTKYSIKRKNGQTISFAENAAILLTPQYNMVGTSVFGDVPREILKSHYEGIKKIASCVTGGLL